MLESRGMPMEKLHKVMEILISGNPVPATYKDHPLHGQWNDSRELHISPDWLLVYQIEANSVIFLRTGAHSDLFP